MMAPEATGVEGSVSAELASVTPTAPAVAAPFVTPVTVSVTVEAGMAAPAVVMTTDVAPAAPHVPVRPATLLLPAATVGVMDGAKKPEG